MNLKKPATWTAATVMRSQILLFGEGIVLVICIFYLYPEMETYPKKERKKEKRNDLYPPFRYRLKK